MTAALSPLLAVLGGDLSVKLADGRKTTYVNLDYAAGPPCSVANLLPWPHAHRLPVPDSPASAVAAAEAAPPYLAGGGASAHVGDAVGDIRWASVPARHEAGTPNLVGAIALAATCRALAHADRAGLAAQEDVLTSGLRARLAAVDGVRELRMFAAEHPRIGVVAFEMEGLSSAQVAASLAARSGIGVRDGLFCSHPLNRRLLGRTATCAGPATAARTSLGSGSSAEHVDRLGDAVAELAAERPLGQRDGRM